MTLGEKLYTLRTKQNMTQEQLAEKLQKVQTLPQIKTSRWDKDQPQILLLQMITEIPVPVTLTIIRHTAFLPKPSIGSLLRFWIKITNSGNGQPSDWVVRVWHSRLPCSWSQ